MRGPCMCGAEDCPRCFPGHFRDGRFIDPEAEANTKHEEQLGVLEVVIDDLRNDRPVTVSVLQDIYERLQKLGTGDLI